MSIDAYSLCPGGRGKKIQFCCPEHVKALEQIDRMIEGEQFSAGLAFVEELEKKSPNCACLTEAKCLFQRSIGLWEQAYETAKGFVEREPKNVVALTELATAAAVIDKPQEAVSALVDSYESVEGDQFPVAIIQATLTVGLALFEGGRIYPAIAVAKQLQAFAPQDQACNAFLYRCLGSESVPLQLKEQVFDLEAPADFEKKSEYDSAVAFLARGQWKRGREIVESLLPYAESWPKLYRNLALIELWFVNDDKAREYVAKYLASPNIDEETAVDTEELLLLLENPTWDDLECLERRTYAIDDFDKAFEQALSSKTLIVSPRLVQAARVDDVPPKNAFIVLNRPMCEKTIDLKLDDVAEQVGYLFAYGKTTSRSARVELFVMPSDLQAAENSLTTTFGELPKFESSEKQEQQPLMWTSNASSPRFQFKDASKLTNETLDFLYNEQMNRFAEEWFNHHYGVLGGKSPKDVVAEPFGARKVEALIRVVSNVYTSRYRETVAALLRARAGLPAPAPIAVPDGLTSASLNDFLSAVPIWRWGRLQLEKCPSDVLAQMLQIANLAAPQEIKAKFAAELVKRPVGEVQYSDRAVAFSVLVDEAILNQDSDKALEVIAEAAAYARSVGESDGQWKFLEIVTRFRRQEIDKVRALAEDVMRNYQDDKPTIQALQRFFEEINAQAQMFLQSQQGRAQAASQAARAPFAANETNETRLDFGVGDRNAAPKEEKKSVIWTPGSDDSNGGTGAGKLWTPD